MTKLTRTLVLASFLFDSGCGPGKIPVASPERDYGYIVLGQAVTMEYGLVSGDTLPEVESRAIPRAVVEAAHAQAAHFRFSPGCTRYFRHSRGFLALLVWKCKPGDKFDDGEGMAAYSSTGEEIGTATSRLSHEYTALHPAQRLVE